ncbi:MAG: hypothetical protein ABI729_00305 [Chitinophagales bacterium]
MKKVIISGLVAGIVMLVVSIAALYFTIMLFPNLALEYYNPAFRMNDESSSILYYIHPFLLGLALAWFWERFKGVLTGSFTMRGIEFGIIYSLIATLPAMLLIYSAMNVTFDLVLTWFLYGFIQSIIAGLVCEKLNP